MSLFDDRYLNGAYRLVVKAYYYRTWKDFDMCKEHMHIQAEIMYVIKGACTVTIHGKPISMRKGEFVFLDANVPHRLIVSCEEPCRMLNIEFSFENVVEYGSGFYEDIGNKKYSAAVPDALAKNNPNLNARSVTCAQLLKTLIDNCDSFKAFFKCKTDYILLKDTDDFYTVVKDIIFEHHKIQKDDSYIQVLLCNMFVKLSRRIREVHQNHENSGSLYVRKAIEYLQQHYDTDIKALDIAQSIKINVSYLQKLFKKNNGITIANYLIRLRMEKAEMFLKNTDLSLMEISQYVGINSRQYFSNLFTKQYGVSPAQYRQNCQYIKQ